MIEVRTGISIKIEVDGKTVELPEEKFELVAWLITRVSMLTYDVIITESKDVYVNIGTRDNPIYIDNNVFWNIMGLSHIGRFGVFCQ